MSITSHVLYDCPFRSFRSFCSLLETTFIKIAGPKTHLQFLSTSLGVLSRPWFCPWTETVNCSCSLSQPYNKAQYSAYSLTSYQGT